MFAQSVKGVHGHLRVVGGGKKSADGKDQKSDNDNLDESFFHKIKKKLFG